MFNEREKASFWIKAKQTNYCWEWEGGKDNCGYGRFNHSLEVLAHRISYQLLYGRIEKEIHILHRCDNPGCINPDHLFVGTHQENMIDKMKKGRARHFGRRSQYYGVTWRKDSKCWRSYLVINRKMKHLKNHKTELEAAKYYDQKAFSIGIKDKLNFPGDYL